MQDQRSIQTNPRNSLLEFPASKKPALSESSESKDRLTDLLEGCFILQKMYGRAPESMEVVERLFQGLLAPFPADKVVHALETWIERSQEFPTPSDIIGLIKRNGRPPMTEAQFVAINRKAGEDRTEADWQFLRDWEAERTGGWDDAVDAGKVERQASEKKYLREEVRRLRAELSRMEGLLRTEQAITKPEPTIDEKVANTVAWMRETGAKESEIEDFVASQRAL